MDALIERSNRRLEDSAFDHAPAITPQDQPRSAC
jgi:hypothetical protein